MGLKKKPARLSGLRLSSVIIYGVLLALVLTAVLLFVVYRDDINDRTLSGILDFFRFGKGESQAGDIHFDAGKRNLFTLCDGRLVVFSPERLVIFNADGSERMSKSLQYEQPALCVSGSKVIAYDRAGTGCVVTDGKNIVAQPEGPVMTASGNGRGAYVLITEESSYRGVATVYNDSDTAVYRWRSGERYIMTAGLSPSGRYLTVGNISQREENAESTLVFLSTDSVTPLAQVVIPGELVLSVTYPDNTRVCAVTEKCAYFYTEEGVPVGAYPFDEKLLLGLYPTSERLFLLLGRYESGLYSTLYCLGYDGAEKAAIAFEEGPSDLSAAGRYCSALVGGQLITYEDGGKSTVTRSGYGDARRICQKPDGSVMVIGSESARLLPLGEE